MSNETFWSWFSQESKALRDLDSDALARRIGEALEEHVGEIGVEVSDDEEDGALDVVLTAHREPLHFQTVKALVAAAPEVQGFRFVPLKPANGFDFTLEADGVELDASSLRFEPLLGTAGVGLKVYLPDAAARDEDVKDLIWLLLESGLGEEVAAGITQVEAAPLSSPEARDALPLPDLAGFLDSSRSSAG